MQGTSEFFEKFKAESRKWLLTNYKPAWEAMYGVIEVRLFETQSEHGEIIMFFVTFASAEHRRKCYCERTLIGELKARAERNGRIGPPIRNLNPVPDPDRPTDYELVRRRLNHGI